LEAAPGGVGDGDGAGAVVAEGELAAGVVCVCVVGGVEDVPRLGSAHLGLVDAGRGVKGDVQVAVPGCCLDGGVPAYEAGARLGEGHGLVEARVGYAVQGVVDSVEDCAPGEVGGRREVECGPAGAVGRRCQAGVGDGASGDGLIVVRVRHPGVKPPCGHVPDELRRHEGYLRADGDEGGGVDLAPVAGRHPGGAARRGRGQADLVELPHEVPAGRVVLVEDAEAEAARVVPHAPGRGGGLLDAVHVEVDGAGAAGGDDVGPDARGGGVVGSDDVVASSRVVRKHLVAGGEPQAVPVVEGGGDFGDDAVEAAHRGGVRPRRDGPGACEVQRGVVGDDDTVVPVEAEGVPDLPRGGRGAVQGAVVAVPRAVRAVGHVPDAAVAAPDAGGVPLASAVRVPVVHVEGGVRRVRDLGELHPRHQPARRVVVAFHVVRNLRGAVGRGEQDVAAVVLRLPGQVRVGDADEDGEPGQDSVDFGVVHGKLLRVVPGCVVPAGRVSRRRCEEPYPQLVPHHVGLPVVRGSAGVCSRHPHRVVPHHSRLRERGVHGPASRRPAERGRLRPREEVPRQVHLAPARGVPKEGVVPSGVVGGGEAACSRVPDDDRDVRDVGDGVRVGDREGDREPVVSPALVHSNAGDRRRHVGDAGAAAGLAAPSPGRAQQRQGNGEDQPNPKPHLRHPPRRPLPASPRER